MKPTTDQLLDQVLTGLARVEPPAHMKSRLHQTLAQRQAETPLRPSFWSRFTLLPARATAAWTLAAATAVFLIAILSTRHHNRPADTPIAAHQNATPATPAAAASSSQPNLAHSTTPYEPAKRPITEVSSRPGAAHLAAVVEMGPPASLLPGDQRPLYSSAPLPLSTDFDTLAAQEMQAPTHPAPPLPMTSEERLIHRFFELNSATVLAALTPPMQLLHEREEQEAYSEFFNPPAPPLPPDPNATSPSVTPSAQNSPAQPSVPDPQSSPAQLTVRATRSSQPQPDLPATPGSSPQPATPSQTQGDRP